MQDINKENLKLQKSLMKDYPMMYITWWDHVGHTESHWRGIEEARELKPILVHTTGFVLHETKDAIVLGQSLHCHEEFNDTYANDICIVKKLINSKRELKI